MSGTDDSPATRFAGFIAKYDPSIAKIVRPARSKLWRMLPAAVELVYDNYNALAIAFGPTEGASDAIVSLAVYPRWVLLYFIRGAKLSDPKKLLQGSGNRGRHITLEGADDLDRPDVRALVNAAIREAPVPMRKSGRGYTVIKTVSRRQRPRRAGS